MLPDNQTNKELVPIKLNVITCPKKKRKRRKRLATMTTVATTAINKTIIKTKQYYQHDTREETQDNSKMKCRTATMSRFNWNECYAAVAKKFRPLVHKKNKRKKSHQFTLEKNMQQKLPKLVLDLTMLDRLFENNLLQNIPTQFIDAGTLVLIPTQLPLNSSKSARETHQVAAAQQEKNDKLREAFNIPINVTGGSSFDSNRRSRSTADTSMGHTKDSESQKDQHNANVSSVISGSESAKSNRNISSRSRTNEHEYKSEKKKKKRHRSSSTNSVRKSEKKKKSKKQKRERWVH